jgi:hypothetical protein
MVKEILLKNRITEIILSGMEIYAKAVIKKSCKK